MLARNLEIGIWLALGAVCVVCCLQDCPPTQLDTDLGVGVSMQLHAYPDDYSDTQPATGREHNTLQAPPAPTPDPLFTPDATSQSEPSTPSEDSSAKPPAPAQPQSDTARTLAAEPPEPEPLLQLPIGWPEGLQLQKWSTPTCGPCKAWDRKERPRLESVMLPDRDASTDPAARSLGITVVPYFQLLRDGQVVWNGRGYWAADAIIGKAQDFGRPL